jgi:LysR family transcriptional regulator, regulator for metE and metH
VCGDHASLVNNRFRTRILKKANHEVKWYYFNNQLILFIYKNMIERIHLAIIREVERQGSLTAAAEHLFLTQSALSHSIKKLEQQLGTDIWLREGRSLRLTQAGQYLLAVANRLLPQLSLAEERLRQFAQGERGTLRIGMECHPCYQWLLKVVSPYLADWPDVDVDVKQKFQFGGIGALFGYEIDMLVTPDPLYKPGLLFQPVFDYEQVLVVHRQHVLAQMDYVRPEQLTNETLITYPVDIDRLDIYNQFLQPAGISPQVHKPIETTDIMLQMVASGRGVAALPRWLVEEYQSRFDVVPVKLGEQGIAKQIYLGIRETDVQIDYVQAFIQLAQRGNADQS